MGRGMIYSSFAKLYDDLFDEQMYVDWQQFVEKHISKTTSSVLDLAGGAGRLAVLLAKTGLDMTVADLSSEMLSLARQHAEDANCTVDLQQVNMLDLSDMGQFDAVTCFADSFCYLDNLDEVTLAFKQVKSHLNDAGVFLFDVITPYQTDTIYPGYMYNYESENQDTAFLWRSFGDSECEHGVVHELTFFNQLPNQDVYERLAEEHYERTYELKQYLQALKKAGFNQIEVSADFGRSEIGSTTTRWFFVVR